MKTMYLLVSTLFLVFVSTSLGLANEITSPGLNQERIDLFVASQRMLAEEHLPPNMKVGMVLSTLGTNSEVSLGVRVENYLNKESTIRLLTETNYLKDEKTIAGFLSIKFVPFSDKPHPIYVGGGIGYADGFRYQVFAGVDLTKNFFAEARYVNLPGGMADKNIYLATGFQFTY